MTWRILLSAGPIFFVTTDDPAFYFQSLGLARKESELCIPLSTRCMLHGSWQRARPDPVFVLCEQAIVKEINRRMVGQAERLVFLSPIRRLGTQAVQKEKPSAEQNRMAERLLRRMKALARLSGPHRKPDQYSAEATAWSPIDPLR